MAPKKAAKGGPVQELAPAANSDDWAKAKANQVNIANKMLEYDALLAEKYGASFQVISEEHLTEEGFWNYFASFILDVYKIPAGRKNAGHPFALDTAVGVWSGLLHQTTVTYRKSKRAATQARAPAPPPPSRPRFCPASLASHALSDLCILLGRSGSSASSSTARPRASGSRRSRA